VFRATRATCEELADGRLREVIEILPGYRECPEFFRGIRGLLRATPRLFDQPEAVVDLETDGRRGEFIITPPPARRRFGRRPRRSIRALPEELAELGFHQEQLLESERRTRVAVTLLADSSLRLAALAELGEQLTRSRSTHGRAAAVIRLLEERFPSSGVRLSHDASGEADDALDLRAESGELRGPPTTTLALEVAGGTVGRLELWAPGEGGFSEDDEVRLRDLVPWIALALEDARSAEHLQGLTRVLEDEVTDWHLVETALEQALHGLPELAIGPETILLVEDDPALRALARRKFEAAGYFVIEAGSDPRTLPSEAELPAPLVVADWKSQRLTPDFLREVRRLHPELLGVLLVPLHSPPTVSGST